MLIKRLNLTFMLLERAYQEFPEPREPEDHETEPAQVVDLDEARQEREEEHQLIEAAKGGDQKAFTKLYRKYQSQLIRFANSRTKNYALAEEYVQETFHKAWGGLANFEYKGKFKNYLFTILANTMHSQGRRARTMQREERKTRELYPDTMHSQPPLAADSALFLKQDLGVVQTLVDEMDEIDQKIFQLKFVNLLPDEEIAEQVGLLPGALRSRIFRIRKKIIEAVDKIHQSSKPRRKAN